MSKNIIPTSYYDILEENAKLKRELAASKQGVVSRKKVIDGLRELLPDAVIGTVLGVSRERVAQIGGRRRANGIVRVGLLGKYDREIKEMALSGCTTARIQFEIASKYHEDITSNDVIRALRHQGVKEKDLIKSRHNLKILEITQRLEEFIKTGKPFKMFNIYKWDYNLCAQMQRIVPNRKSGESAFKQWAEYMDVKWEGYSFIVDEDGKRDCITRK